MLENSTMRLMRKHRPWALVLGGILVVPLLAGRAQLAVTNELSRRSAEESLVEFMSTLDVQRSGRVRITAIDMGSEPGGDPVPMTYTLRAPLSDVEDADIRGLLDGTTQYDFNQGTAYHMRLGRRYHARDFGRYELKRSLIRWTLPELPADAVVRSITAQLWVEAYLEDSPLYREEISTPLHVYAYAIGQPWAEGNGGVKADDFSSAAPGEVWWNEARKGELSWPDPGALRVSTHCCVQPYVERPIAHDVITAGDRPLTLTGSRLARHAEQRIRTGGALDLLLKLDDSEEDRVGTELALLSSNFGDKRDLQSKRPTITMVVELHRPAAVLEHDFMIEAGAEEILPIQRHDGRTVLIGADILDSEGSTIPDLWVRGGRTGGENTAAWEPLNNPVQRRWDWSQIKVSAALNQVEWGEDFSVEILETWIKPGPREKQVPHLILLAPSGAIHRIRGTAISPSMYRVAHQPTELGLWRYVWSFETMPEQQPNSHIGFGMFYVSPATESSRQASQLHAFAEDVALEFSGADRSEPDRLRASAKYNQFVRWHRRVEGLNATTESLDVLVNRIEEERSRN